MQFYSFLQIMSYIYYYHFQQALIRHIGQLGLKRAYAEDIGTRDVLRKIMALCYIPNQHIRHQFQNLKEKCTTLAMAQFATYFEQTWLTLWLPEDWCVFGCPIRTNNTLEGLNNKFNSTCKHNIPFYELINKIHKECTAVSFDIGFVYQNILSKRSNPAYAGINQQLFTWWSYTEQGNMSSSDLLIKCARVYAPENIQLTVLISLCDVLISFRGTK